MSRTAIVRIKDWYWCDECHVVHSAPNLAVWPCWRAMHALHAEGRTVESMPLVDYQRARENGSLDPRHG